MAEHTPTPWFKNSKFEVGPRPRTDDQNDGMLHPVADVFGDNREADAALIVKAVNRDHHFDALVKALEEIEDLGANGVTAARLGNIAHAALIALRAAVGGSPK